MATNCIAILVAKYRIAGMTQVAGMTKAAATSARRTKMFNKKCGLFESVLFFYGDAFLFGKAL